MIVFYITTETEKNEFETQFEDATDKIFEAFEDIGRSRMGAIASLGVAAMAHGLDFRYRWPFVTLVR